MEALCLTLDPGGSAAWQTTLEELNAGLQEAGADPKLSECARKDWERARLGTLSERFFNPSRNGRLPRWSYTHDVHQCLEATKGVRSASLLCTAHGLVATEEWPCMCQLHRMWEMWSLESAGS